MKLFFLLDKNKLFCYIVNMTGLDYIIFELTHILLCVIVSTILVSATVFLIIGILLLNHERLPKHIILERLWRGK